MSCQLCQQARDQTIESVCSIPFNVQLFGQLSIDSLDQLPYLIDQMGQCFRQWLLLISTPQGYQVYLILLSQRLRYRRTVISLVSEYGQVGVLGQQFCSHCQVGGTCRSQFEIHNDAAQGDQEIQLVAENGLLLRGYLTIVGSIRGPAPSSTRHQVKRYHRHRQTVDDAVSILAQVQDLAYHTPQQFDSLRQISTPAVIPTTLWEMWKQCQIRHPVIQQFGFDIPTAAFADQGDSNQTRCRCSWALALGTETAGQSAARYHQRSRITYVYKQKS